MLTRCAIFSWASHSTVKASSQFGLCLFRAGSGLGWFVCSLNSFLCVGLLLCSPPPAPSSPPLWSWGPFFSSEGLLVGRGGRDRWEELFGGIVNGRAAVVIPPSSLQYGITSPCPAHTHRQLCLTATQQHYRCGIAMGRAYFPCLHAFCPWSGGWPPWCLWECLCWSLHPHMGKCVIKPTMINKYNQTVCIWLGYPSTYQAKHAHRRSQGQDVQCRMHRGSLTCHAKGLKEGNNLLLDQEEGE